MRKLYRRIRFLVTMLVGLSPFSSACRFIPTCSEYCDECFRKYGAMHGAWLCILRLVRCTPLFKGGYDPVP